MTERAASDPSSGIDDFLIAEYEHFAESFWRSEELGEKRLNFFISLLTAAVAGLVVLATSDSGFSASQVQWSPSRPASPCCCSASPRCCGCCVATT